MPAVRILAIVSGPVDKALSAQCRHGGQDRDAVRPQILEALETMGELVREGKIVHFGLSNETAWGTMQYLHMADDRDLPRVVSIQNEYSLLRRGADRELLPAAAELGVGFLPYFPLYNGLFTGKFSREGGPAEGGRVVDDAGREGDGASKRVVAPFSGDMARNSARRALNFFFAFVSR